MDIVYTSFACKIKSPTPQSKQCRGHRLESPKEGDDRV